MYTYSQFTSDSTNRHNPVKQGYLNKKTLFQLPAGSNEQCCTDRTTDGWVIKEYALHLSRISALGTNPFFGKLFKIKQKG